jgi:glucose-6-phosphate-specific signal transduction histidine kinase
MDPILTEGPDDTMSANEKNWSLDKRIPVALILFLIAQTLGVGILLGRDDQRLSTIETWIHDNTATDRRLAVIETRLDTVHESLGKIERRLKIEGE